MVLTPIELILSMWTTGKTVASPLRDDSLRVIGIARTEEDDSSRIGGSDRGEFI